MKGGIIVGAGAAAAASAAAFVVDRQVRKRRATVSLDAFTPPTPDRAGYVRADDGVRLYYEEDGPSDAGLTVVLIHGFCQNHDDLVFQRRAIIEEFGEWVRVLSYDLRSHGRSSRSDGEHATIEQLGNDLHTVLDGLAAEGPLVLVGHSMGGMALLAFAAKHAQIIRDRVRGVALISTTTGKLAWLTLGVPTGLARMGDPALQFALRGVRRQSLLIERGRARVSDAAWMFTRRLAFGPNVDPALVEFMTLMIGSTPVDVVADFIPTLMTNDTTAALPVLARARVVIVCGEDDLVTPPEHSRAMADRLPRAKFVLVPDAGHQVLMERPDVVNPPVVALVRQALVQQVPS